MEPSYLLKKQSHQYPIYINEVFPVNIIGTDDVTNGNFWDLLTDEEILKLFFY